MVLTVVAAVALSAGGFAQGLQAALPKCTLDAPPVTVEVTDVIAAKVLPSLRLERF